MRVSLNYYPTAQSRVQITREQSTDILRHCTVIWTVGCCVLCKNLFNGLAARVTLLYPLCFPPQLLVTLVSQLYCQLPRYKNSLLGQRSLKKYVLHCSPEELNLPFYQTLCEIKGKLSLKTANSTRIMNQQRTGFNTHFSMDLECQKYNYKFHKRLMCRASEK